MIPFTTILIHLIIFISTLIVTGLVSSNHGSRDQTSKNMLIKRHIWFRLCTKNIDIKSALLTESSSY